VDLGGWVALVSVGVGRAIALALAEHGAPVAVTDPSVEHAAGVAAEIRARGAASATWALDVAARAQVDEVVAALLVAFGRIDVLVNNAGISLPCPVVSMFDDRRDRVVGVSLRGTFLCTHAVLPTMIAALPIVPVRRSRHRPPVATADPAISLPAARTASTMNW